MKLMRDHNDREITNKGEAVVETANPVDWEEFKQSQHNQYILKKIAEVETVADDPSTWMTEEEFWQRVK